MPAHEIAAAVRAGEVSAVALAEAALARIEALDPTLNAFTDVTAARARAQAAAVDAAVARGADPGPLAGVPFAVKNLFDIDGLTTRAGSKINRDRAPAGEDATLIRRLDAAGAVLLGGLNMGEYAYDFTGENAHDGACRNPHDPARMTGGSSSGSGAATAAGLAPISLGSDTNGSIRVPASLCGVFGLKPTYGRLSRAGSFPFCDSLDHLGPFARTARDLALAYDAMQGPDAGDPACRPPSSEPVVGALARGLDGLRVATLGGWFAKNLTSEAADALARTAAALGAAGEVELDGVEAGRAAAFVITNVESSRFHLDRMRTRIDDFDPDTRDRFLAGALLPGGWYVRAQQVRRWWAERFATVFTDVDVLIAPATPSPAPAIGQRTLELDGAELLLRPNLGLFTQPVSCAGLPVVCAPVARAGELPIGVQLIAAPWREDLCVRAAHALEDASVAVARRRQRL
ncbi:MAG: AtzE family amidohydrolase [Alphaproteobacteria bacterium]|nr:AtzE family amidohydrolase [Alphaproteobacteria bacterium]